MFYLELQAHFKKFGFDEEIEYFENTWFKAHREKYEFMLLMDIDPTNIEEWSMLEYIFEAPFTYEQAMLMAENMYNKFDIIVGELECVLRTKRNKARL